MVIGELAREIRGELHENAAFEANEIVMKALEITRTELILKAKDNVSEEAASAARAMRAESTASRFSIFSEKRSSCRCRSR